MQDVAMTSLLAPPSVTEQMQAADEQAKKSEMEKNRAREQLAEMEKR